MDQLKLEVGKEKKKKCFHAHLRDLDQLSRKAPEKSNLHCFKTVQSTLGKDLYT